MLMNGTNHDVQEIVILSEAKNLMCRVVSLPHVRFFASLRMTVKRGFRMTIKGVS